MNGGIIIVNKPKGYTSRDIVNMVGRFLGTSKVGHCGTLDPVATGVLVIGVGDGLKILEFMNNDTKEYVAKVKLGIKTDTLDITGKVIEEVKDYKLDKDKLKEVVDSFKKSYLQEVPLYSSVKVSGVRLYKYAREGKEVELPKREVVIHEIELLNSNDDSFTFKAKVSKGTYIRSLIRDIGDEIGIPCTMEELERTKQGVFDIKEAYTISDIENNKFDYITLSKVLSDKYSTIVDSDMEFKINNGAILPNIYDEDLIVFKNIKDEVIGIYGPYEKDKNKIKPIRVFRKWLYVKSWKR